MIESGKVNEVLKSICAAVERHSQMLRNFIQMQDEELRSIFDNLSGDLHARASEAASENRKITLKLDDLFEFVTPLIKSAKTIEAVDIDVNRWEYDTRAIRYFNANREALRSGATIRRIYIINPHVTTQDFELFVEIVKKHYELNKDEAVLSASGKIEIAVIFHEDVPQACKYRDYAIFDKEKVLHEKFDTQWRTTNRGYFTKSQDDIEQYVTRFEDTWKASTLVQEYGDWIQAFQRRVALPTYKYDVFVGYCSTARAAADKLIKLIKTNGLDVKNWETDFQFGNTILEEINIADKECRAAVFLFTKDDPLDGKDAQAAPRDNVVLEAGYFLHSKGSKRTLILLEEGAKMPADLGGIIFPRLRDRDDLEPIRERLENWLANLK